MSRSTDGDGRDILSRAASCSSCFLHRSSRCLKWSTPAVSSSSDRVPDHLTVGRNLHMKDAGTITSHPGGASGFQKASMASSTHAVEPWSLCCCQHPRASWVRGNDAREPLHEAHTSTRVRVVKGHRTTRRKRMGWERTKPHLTRMNTDGSGSEKNVAQQACTSGDGMR